MRIRGSIAQLAILVGMALPEVAVLAQRQPVQNRTQTTHTASLDPVSGAELVQNAVRLLESRATISARIRQQVNLFGKEMVGAGTYLEQRTGGNLRFRLESKIRLGEETSTLLEVCDGQYLWRYQRLHEEGTLTRIDIDRVLRALEEVDQLGRIETVEQWPGLGGLPKLLRGLYVNFDFPTVEQAKLDSTALSESPSAVQLPVWRVRGQWKRERLAELLPDRKDDIAAGKPVNLAELPPPLPQAVVLYLAADDLFPHRIEYYRSSSEQAGQGRGAQQPIVVIELIQLNVNVPIDPSRFFYNPGNLDCIDQTGDFLKQLGLEE